MMLQVPQRQARAGLQLIESAAPRA